MAMIFREIKELIAYHSKYGRRFAEHDCRNVFKKAIRDLQSVGFGTLEGKRILDLGCGQRFPFALQSATAGAEVTALDLDYVNPDVLPLAFVRMVKKSGLKRACKSVLRRLLFDPSYYEALEKACGKRLRDYFSRINFVVADPQADNYPLPSDSFDVIGTNAVVEHVENVQRFAAEISRLLHGGGIFTASFITFIRCLVDTIWSGHFQMKDHLRTFLLGITFERIGFPVGFLLIVYFQKNIKRLFPNIWIFCCLKVEILIMTLADLKESNSLPLNLRAS